MSTLRQIRDKIDSKIGGKSTPASEFEIETQPLSEADVNVAIRELRETPEIVAQSVKELKALLGADTTIHYDTSDTFLQIFLRPTKYFPKSAFELMKRIAEYRFKYKDIVANLMPGDEAITFTEHDIVNILKDRDQFGRRILVINAGKSWDTSKVTNDQLLRCLYILHLAAMLEPQTQVKGLVVIMNLKDMGMKQVTAFSPSFAVRLMAFIQDAMALRLKELHMIHNPMVWNVAWKIIKPLQTEKTNKRTHFHASNMESLHKFISADHLPEDFGGKKAKIDYSAKDWYPSIQKQQDFFLKWNACGKVKTQ